MKRKKLTVHQRAEASARRKPYYDGCSPWTAHRNGHLAGYRAAQRHARVHEKKMLEQIRDLELSLKTSREIVTYEAERYRKLAVSVRNWGRNSISETRPEPQYFSHPLKRI